MDVAGNYIKSQRDTQVHECAFIPQVFLNVEQPIGEVEYPKRYVENDNSVPLQKIFHAVSKVVIRLWVELKNQWIKLFDQWIGRNALSVQNIDGNCLFAKFKNWSVE